MKSIKQQRLEFLEGMVNYYSADTSRRAFNDELANCLYYDGATGNKCAIGRYIKPEDYKNNEYIDEGHNANDYCVFALLPEEVRRLGKEFLRAVQKLHDRHHYWIETGLSCSGLNAVEQIKLEYC